MKRMGIQALYQKPRLSPLLTRIIKCTVPSEGCRDQQGQSLLGSRYNVFADGQRVLLPCGDHGLVKPPGTAWRLSNTLDASFCTEALEEAIRKLWDTGDINTDQGSQFTSEAFITILNTNGNFRIQHG